MEIIIRGSNSFGKTRSEQEVNMRKEWGSTMTDEHLDKLKHMEKKQKEFFGKSSGFARQTDIGKVE
jgi:hypothetical protein